MLEQQQWQLARCDESDCPQIGYIAWKSFENSEINAYLRPIHMRPKNPTEEEKTNNAIKRILGNTRNPKLITMKAVDPKEPDTIAGYAVWTMTDPSEKPDIIEKVVDESTRDPTVDEKASKRFKASLEENAHKIMGGRKHMNLIAIATHPDFLRKGVASELIEWGLREAERQNLPVLIESVPHAVAVYERNGLANKGKWTIDYEVKDDEGRLTGETKTLTLYMMIREA